MVLRICGGGKTLSQFCVGTVAVVALLLPRLLVAQLSGDDPVNSNVTIGPSFYPTPATYFYDATQEGGLPGAPPTPTLFEAPINANFLGRAAAISDSTRLASFAGGNFLPAAIPVAGQPFFGSGPRANLQGSGSAVGIKAVGEVFPGAVAGAVAQILVKEAGLPSDGTGSTNFAIQQAFGRLNRLKVGLMESAFADPSAVPETLDLAGPNARTTVYSAGLGTGQGRLSYDFFSDAPDGLKATASIEQPRPQIQTVTTTGTYARSPDFVGAVQYVEGDYDGPKFYERWHLQFGTLFRNLGLENSPGTFRQDVFGYGLSLSGALRFVLNPNLETLDRVMFSVTYGEGISRYITDLNAAPDTNDAVVNVGNELVPLPTLAWYIGYTHNWTDYFRSTATYSQVNLDSVAPLGATVSPYRVGDYVAVNLVYHRAFQTQTDGKLKNHNFFTGIEYLYGQKETLDAASGDAHRIMLVVAISN
jgi:hypothetical protein